MAAPAPFQAAELEALHRVARTLLSERDYGELLAALLEAALAALGADRGCILVSEAGEFHVTAASNFRSDRLEEAEREISTSIARDVVAQNQAVLLDDAARSERFGENASVRRLALRSVLCAPLLTSPDATALLYLEQRDIAHHFTERHRRLLEEIRQLAEPRLRVAIAVEHARARARQLDSDLARDAGILTADPAMRAVLDTLAQVAATDLSLLIQGETGTGKELLARAVYRNSKRAAGPFVVLNCAAIPASLVESELFGYVRGAFTGAHRDRAGVIAAAHRGTLFLDEIGEMPFDLQGPLLRVLQSGDYLRLGSTRVEHADVRVVAATNRDLEGDVDHHRFRADLFYRLAGAILRVPPLRARPHDVRLLADHFLRVYAARYCRPVPRLSGAALVVLEHYPFPGNVRELENEMARLVAMAAPGAEIAAEALNERVRTERAAPPPPPPYWQPTPLEIPAKPAATLTLDEVEKQHIRLILAATDGNRTRAAQVLGISREGLRTKMLRLGLRDV